MRYGGYGRAWGALALAAPMAVLLLAAAGAAAPARAEENPFLPPQERQSDIDQRLQKRIDRAVTAMEERLARSLVDALEGKGNKDGALPRALRDAMARQQGGAASPTAAVSGGMPPPLPALPPLPNMPVGREAVPSGAVFIGCLDGKAFFQDRGGSPFLADPRSFPPAAGGAAACAL